MTALIRPGVRPIALALAGRDRGAVRKAVKHAGFRQPEESTRHLLSLWAQEAFQCHAEEALGTALAAADPDMALLGLARYVDAHREHLRRPFDFEPARLALLMPVLGASRFLTNHLAQYPGAIEHLATSNWLDREKPIEALHADLAGPAPGGSEESLDFESLQRLLRRVRASEMLRIAVRDLTGRSDVDGVMRELTRLAEATLDKAVRACDAQLRQRYGVPWVEMIGGERMEGEFVVIGMGKLGAGELNFSSDVDLLYVYSSSQGQTEGGVEKERLGLHAYYVKLAELVTRAIGEVTEDGFVFRVDLGLRPDGNRGQLANSLAASELYYASWGETWERSALLRARPVAGSRRLGEEFSRVLQPILFRKTLDMATVEDMRQMKKKIDAESRRRVEGGWDVKLGRGGIREIEFVVHSLQLVYAGRTPALRVRETLLGLDRLREAGFLGAEEVAALAGAYRFYRALEHRLQMAEDRQTHRLPTREEELLRLVRSMGFFSEPEEAAREAFDQRLLEHRTRVEAAFDRLFAEQEPDTSEEEVDPSVKEIIELEMPPEEERRRLAESGFEDPSSAAARLVWLRDPPSSANLSLRSRRLLRSRGPVFLQEIIRSPDPDRALTHLERFFSSSQARYTLFTVLDAHRETLRLLIRLFGTSDYLSDAFNQHPELLDSLVLSTYATVKKSRAEMEREVNETLDEFTNVEAWLDAIRRFKRGEVLRVAFNDLSGELDRAEVSAQLSDLADTCLAAALRIGRTDLDERYGSPEDPARSGGVARFALLGMGKLGGREIDYHSDLDVIYVFDPDGETHGGSRGRRITNFEYFVKLGQRIISVMTLRTAEGVLYEIDTRLRPSGHAGALVTSLESFERYHQTSARVWERQALIKARLVAGDAALGHRLEQIARRFAYDRPWQPSVRTEIARVRRRMEMEIAREKPDRYNLKTGRGGLVDVEFIVQALQLEHGASVEGAQASNTLAALAALRRSGHLDEREAVDLEEGYRFLRTLEDRLRLLHNRSTSDLETSGPYLEKLARRLEYASDGKGAAGASLLDEYRSRTERIRSIYERIFGTATRAAPGRAEGARR